MAAFMAVAAASSPSFLQVNHQRDAALLYTPPRHLLHLPAANDNDTTFFYWDLCDTTVYSNLGGLGPDSGPEELRFTNVGEYNGKSVDLVFVNTTTYQPHNVLRNTARGCFGVINVKHDSSVKVNVSFVEGGTNIPMKWQKHYSFSVFDADCSETGCEEVDLFTSDNNLDEVCVDKKSELQIAVKKLGGAIEEDFTGTTLGEGYDNPPPLGSLQLDRTVTWVVGSTQTLQASLQVSRSKQGRNFLFAGATEICEEKKATPPPTPAPDCVSGQCTIWGDPHLITFDVSAKRKRKHPAREAFFRTRGWKSDQLSIYDQGTFWLVKSQSVHIQARYWHNKTHPDWTNLGALAIGGPFIGNNTLIIRSLSEALTWNGGEILAALPSRFANEYIKARYRHDAELVQNGESAPGVDVELPDGVSLTVNRWMYSLAVKIVMCPQKDGQEGQCGNFDGSDEDEIEEAKSPHGLHRVSESEWLF